LFGTCFFATKEQVFYFNAMSQVSTMTIFEFRSKQGIFHALKQMRLGHRHLKNIEGLAFYRLFGTGRGFGFNLLPDWNHFALFQIWESEEKAIEFLIQSPFIKMYTLPSSGFWAVFLQHVQSHGSWNGSNPFRNGTISPIDKPYVASLTRATIKPSKAIKFWRFAQKVHNPTMKSAGLIYSKGIGTDPFTQMATFSIWESEKHLKQFAYNTRAHQKAIKLTHDTGWYKEELFARFQPKNILHSGDIQFPKIKIPTDKI
jgi:quinol monooxygenase YgiN